MSNKNLLLAISDYLLDYLDCSKEKYGTNLKDDVEQLVSKYLEIDNIYEGLEPNLYNYVMNMLWTDTDNLIDKCFDFIQEVYGENLYTKLLELMINNIYGNEGE